MGAYKCCHDTLCHLAPGRPYCGRRPNGWAFNNAYLLSLTSHLSFLSQGYSTLLKAVKNNTWKFHFPSRVLFDTLGQDPPFVGRKELTEFTEFTFKEFH